MGSCRAPIPRLRRHWLPGRFRAARTVLLSASARGPVLTDCGVILAGRWGDLPACTCAAPRPCSRGAAASRRCHPRDCPAAHVPGAVRRSMSCRAEESMAISQDPTSLKETWLDLDGRRLLYRTNADSPPPADAPVLIHVHGFAISGRYLMPTAWRLAPGYRTYVPDLPGFGRS